MLFIPISKINITKESIAPLGMLIILLVERYKASIYEYDEVRSVKYSSWEVEMTKYELIVFYKSRAAFLTVGIFRLLCSSCMVDFYIKQSGQCLLCYFHLQ